MSVYYGGVPLESDSAGLRARLEATLSLGELLDFARQSCPVGTGAALSFPWLPRELPPRLQTLRWPRDASRWAVGHFLASSKELDQIRPQAFPPSGWTRLPLFLNDGRRSVAPLLWMLPPRPLWDCGSPGHYLLTLVDDRFFWWDVPSTLSASGSWSALFAAAGAALGVTLTNDAVPAAYLTPPAALAGSDLPLPRLLDAAAAAAGMRVVRLLDGTVKVVAASTAQAAAVSQAGLSAAKAGGFFRSSDLSSAVPKSVTVSFPRSDSGVMGTSRTDYAEALTSLGLGAYSGVTGGPWTRLIPSAAIANWAGGGAPANDAELAALAKQTASDWYSWRMAEAFDLALCGTPAWLPTGAEYLVEWEHRVDGPGVTNLNCRPQRPPWNERQDTPLLQASSAGSGGNIITGPTIINPVISNPVLILPPVTITNPTTGQPLNPPAQGSKLGVSSASSVNIPGLTGGVAGRLLVLWNTGAGKIVLQHGTGTAGQQISTPMGFDYTLWPGHAVILEYDGTVWRFDVPTFAAGGTSSPLTYASTWLKPGTNISIVDNGDGSDTINNTAAAAAAAKYESYFRMIFTAGSTPERWYYGGHPQTDTASAGANFLNSVLYALPFLATRGGTLDRIGVSVGTGIGTQTVRLGIYTNKGDGVLYPDQLVLDTGDLAAGTAQNGTVVAGVISQALNPFTLYWLVFLSSASSPGINIKSLAGTSSWPILGDAGTFSPTLQGVGWSTSQAYGALPGTFPASPTTGGIIAAGTNSPLIGVRFSA